MKCSNISGEDSIKPLREKKKEIVKEKKRQKPKYYLRSRPKNVSDKEEFKLDDENRPLTYIVNDYENNGDRTITDHATGLMWQQSGSDDDLEYNKALSYIKKLNRERFAGYSDWRLPTIEELMSLLEESQKGNDLFMDEMFDKVQWWCWSADKRSSGSAWGVYFGSDRVYWRDLYVSGKIYWYYLTSDLYVRAVRSCQ